MKRALLLAAVSVLAGCGAPGLGGSGSIGPPSAQSLAANDSDYSGMSKCPQSGSWDDYLKAEQQSDPTNYQTDKANWDQLKASGADDGYVAAYAQDASECAIFGAAAPPKGKVTYVFVVRFKDEASAQAGYKTSAKTFHVSDADLASVKAAGGTVTQGSETGLGANSVQAYVSILGTSIFAGFWQNKRFEVADLAANTQVADSQAICKKINGRIR